MDPKRNPCANNTFIGTSLSHVYPWRALAKSDELCCTNHHRGADIDACVDGRGRENGAGWATSCVILYF